MFKPTAALAAALALTAMSFPSFAATTAASTSKVAPTKPSYSATTTAAAVRPKSEKAIGEVSSFEAGSLVLKMKSKSETFALPSTAKITSHGKAVTVADLKVGAKVEVTFKQGGTTMTASHVTLLGHA